MRDSGKPGTGDYFIHEYEVVGLGERANYREGAVAENHDNLVTLPWIHPDGSHIGASHSVNA